MSTQEPFGQRLRRELQERYPPAEAQPAPERTPEQARAERKNVQLRAMIEKARARNRWTVNAW